MTRPEASKPTLLTKETDLPLSMILSTLNGKIAKKSTFKHHPADIVLPHQKAKRQPRWLTGPP
ncbi:hypothetical protein [Spirosoma endbachense]|uniref:Uncharacterized protein n=1 Tax=Spirosoma endbachense TaxID=2666025 RepID=A0A6P1W6R4_9BACT|nr:hypothetical protein [Spirosoma endbachense]QHV99727.1 hypothetical protein GJR95_34040 [Spirosoma endbachense]